LARLHVAVLDEEFPFPLNSGKRLRSFHLVTRLARDFRITYVAHANPDAEELRLATDALRQAGVTVVPVDYRIPPKEGLGFYARLVVNLASRLPYSVATHTSAAMRAAMDRLVATDPPDLWHCEWTPYAQAMANRPGRWVVMAHNVESLIWQRYTETERNPLKRWFLRRQWRRFERFEAWAYSAATRAVAVSPEDAALMRDRFGAPAPAVVENGVDTAAFRPDPHTPHDPARILFLGSLDWRPNQDGVRVLIDDVFPRVKQAEPTARVMVVGRKPPAWLKELANQPGVELHADVPDVRPFLHQSGVLAVPLRVGGGSRLKILEALATGLPVVTTTVGVEGLRLSGGEHCAVADTAEAFAAALTESIRRPAAAAEMAARGRHRVVSEYDWAGLATKLGAVWRAAVSGTPPPI
jgi:glycosyltransferase involved in cell wall biosynthesis